MTQKMNGRESREAGAAHLQSKRIEACCSERNSSVPSVKRMGATMKWITITVGSYRVSVSDHIEPNNTAAEPSRSSNSPQRHDRKARFR